MNLLHYLGANPPTDAELYRPYAENTFTARIITLVTLAVAVVGLPLLVVLGADRSSYWLVLLPLVFASGPAVWLLLYSFKRNAGVMLGGKAVHMRQPLRFFNRSIPYDQIGACGLVNGTVAILWLRPRLVAVGDDPRPPKIVMIRSVEVEHAKACIEQLHAMLTPHPDWTSDDATSRISRRAVWRRVLFYTTFPFIAFIVVLIAIRIAFSFLAL